VYKRMFTIIEQIYLKHVFSDDPIFKEVKIVLSIYDDGFEAPLDAGLKEKIAHEGVEDENLSVLETPSYENLYRYVMHYADGFVLASEHVSPALCEAVRRSGKPVLEYQAPDTAEFFDNYARFYDSL
ncbi:MAG: glycogen synthase, partial [Alistipes sp.]|nr:glycogen synthase [Alistipes sp.]